MHGNRSLHAMYKYILVWMCVYMRSHTLCCAPWARGQKTRCLLHLPGVTVFRELPGGVGLHRSRSCCVHHPLTSWFSTVLSKPIFLPPSLTLRSQLCSHFLFSIAAMWHPKPPSCPASFGMSTSKGSLNCKMGFSFIFLLSYHRSASSYI